MNTTDCITLFSQKDLDLEYNEELLLEITKNDIRFTSTATCNSMKSTTTLSTNKTAY